MKTKKGKHINVLPVVGEEQAKILYQPNRITNGRWKGFTLMQSKIFISIIDKLQAAIKSNMLGQQMELFKEADGLIKVSIPLKEICRPDQYKFIHQQADELSSIKLYFESRDRQGKYNSIANLFHRFDIPKLQNGIKTMHVFMHQDSATKLIEIDKNISGNPINFTKYLKGVGLNAKNKYTYKLYMIIASWKIKGGFRIALQELKEQLGIPADRYKSYKDFRLRVLEPVQRELLEHADCWFNCAAPGFEETEKQSRKVLFLNFKVITKVEKEHKNKQEEYIRDLLTGHAGFTAIHFREIEHIFAQTTDYTELAAKVVELISYVKESANEVGHPQAYIIKSLRNFVH